MARMLSREEFNLAVEALWTEIEYSNNLPRRTDEDEAKDVPGFLTLIRRYVRKAEDAWADQAGPVKEAEETLRKIAAICVRGMLYTWVWKRGE